MAFQRFVETGRRGYTPKVSVWTRGQIGFNRSAVDKLQIKKHKYAILYFDPETRTIGIKFTNDDQESGIFKIVHGKTGAFLSAIGFVQHYEIPHKKTRKYDVEYDEGEKMWLVQLEQ